jgi:hypothetical protein
MQRNNNPEDKKTSGNKKKEALKKCDAMGEEIRDLIKKCYTSQQHSLRHGHGFSLFDNTCTKQVSDLMKQQHQCVDTAGKKLTRLSR